MCKTTSAVSAASAWADLLWLQMDVGAGRDARTPRVQGWLQNMFTSFGLAHVPALDVPGRAWEHSRQVWSHSRPRGVSQLRWPLAEGRASAPGMCASVTQCPAPCPWSPKVRLGHMALRIPPFLLPSWGSWWPQVFCASDGTPLACPLSRPTQQFETNCHHGHPCPCCHLSLSSLLWVNVCTSEFR